MPLVKKNPSCRSEPIALPARCLRWDSFELTKGTARWHRVPSIAARHRHVTTSRRRQPDSSRSMAEKATDQIRPRRRHASRASRTGRRAGPRRRRARAAGGRQHQGRRRQVGEGPADGDAGRGRRARLRSRRAVEVLTVAVKLPERLKGTALFRGLINDAKSAAGSLVAKYLAGDLGGGALRRRAGLRHRGRHAACWSSGSARSTPTAWWPAASPLIGLIAALVVTVKEQEEEIAETQAEKPTPPVSPPTRPRRPRCRCRWRCSALFADPSGSGRGRGRRQDSRRATFRWWFCWC